MTDTAAPSRKISSVIVTGGAGFIGSNFVRFLLRERPGWRITNLDALTYSGNLENLADIQDRPGYRFVKGDICDRALLDELLPEHDAIAHLAAESHVDRSIYDAGPFVRTNVLGTQMLLDAARQAWGGRGTGGGGGRFLHVSTDEVYGSLPLDRRDLKFTEQTPLDPHSPYSASKAASDLLVQACGMTHGLDVSITRCSNNFGPWQFPEKVIPLFVTNLLQGEQVPLYGDGLNVRDWLHVEDHCEALLTVLERGTPGGIYNIGGDNERSNLDLTGEILRLMGFAGGKAEAMIRRVKDRPAHDRRYAIDARKLATELGWRPTRSAWPGALEQTVNWYREHEDWWRRVRSGAYREFYDRQYGAQRS